MFDTNVLIYALQGSRPAALALLQSRADHAISRITWMEVMLGCPEGKEADTLAFLRTFRVLEVNALVAERAVALRREFRMKLPDAIIYATALLAGRVLVTYNTRNFSARLGAVFVPEG